MAARAQRRSGEYWRTILGSGRSVNKLLVLLPVLIIGIALRQYIRSKRWSPRNLHCYITGGSQGLGLALAIQLAKEGANVSIVARDEVKLRVALQDLEAARVGAEQKFNTYSHDLRTAQGAQAALRDVCSPHDGQAPDVVIMCAGQAHPGFFVEAEEEDLQRGVDANYMTALWTAWVTSKMMVRQRIRGKIILVASTLAYTAFVGWSRYSPMRHALRGLADTLRSEFLLYNIDVHIYFPNTMSTPGYEEENRTKPKVTLEIENADTPMTPEAAANALLNGVKKGQAHIAGDIITDIFRASTRGAAPYHNVLYDALLGTMGWIAVPVWRWATDLTVKQHRKEHEEYLIHKGFFESPIQK